MAFQAALRRKYPTRIYTTDLIIEGRLEPLGHLLDDFNDPSKTGFLIHDVHISPLVAGSDLGPFALKQVTANKMDFHLAYIAGADDRAEQTLMRRTEQMIVYTSRFVIRGDFHMGGETRLRDFADGLLGDFLPASDVVIYPLFQPSIAIPRNLELVLVNKQRIQLYHPVANEQTSV